MPRTQVAAIQRARLLAGALGAIEEHGYAHTTVAQITGRSRVSRRTFYELFDSREACLAALIEDVIALVEGEISREGLEGLPWRERVGGGLRVILSFFDREPALARVCVVQSLLGGQRVLALREATLVRLAGVLDEGRAQGARGGECSALTAEGLVGAALTILYTRLARGKREPLVALTSELMAMIVLPYLGPAAARREQTQPRRGARSDTQAQRPLPMPAHRDPLAGLPMRLTYRTAKALECIASRPGVSNRQVAERAGISDQGQISKLLARLERLGLIENTGEGHLKGEPNAWRLTTLGHQVALRLSANTREQKAAA